MARSYLPSGTAARTCENSSGTICSSTPRRSAISLASSMSEPTYCSSPVLVGSMNSFGTKYGSVATVRTPRALISSSRLAGAGESEAAAGAEEEQPASMAVRPRLRMIFADVFFMILSSIHDMVFNKRKARNSDIPDRFDSIMAAFFRSSQRSRYRGPVDNVMMMVMHRCESVHDLSSCMVKC